MASGHMNRVKRPDTWLHRPMLQNVKKVLANPEPSTHGTNRTTGPMSELVSAYRGQSGSRSFGVVRAAFDPKRPSPTSELNSSPLKRVTSNMQRNRMLPAGRCADILRRASAHIDARRFSKVYPVSATSMWVWSSRQAYHVSSRQE